MGQIISSYVKSSCDIFFWRDFPLIHILKNPPADYWRQNSLEILSLSLFLRKRGIWSFAIRIPSIRDQSLIRGTLSEDVLTSRSSISFPIASNLSSWHHHRSFFYFNETSSSPMRLKLKFGECDELLWSTDLGQHLGRHLARAIMS